MFTTLMLSLNSGSCDDSESEMSGESIEIPIAVKEIVSAFDASGSYHRIYRLADSDAPYS